MSFVNQNNSVRPSDEQQYGQVIKKIAEEGVCPFCTENLPRFHKHPLVEKKFWWVTDNMYPYKPAKHHRLIISKTHLVHLKELSKEAWDELEEIILSETSERDITGGTLVMRFGDTRYTGASVSHLHAHIIQSNPDDPTYAPDKGVIMRIG